MIFNLNALGDFLHILEDDWKRYKTAKAEKELKLMEENAKTGRFIGLMFASFMYTAGLFFNTFIPIATMRAINRNYQTETLRQSNDNITHVLPIPAKVLIYTVHSSVMTSSSPKYELLFLAQYFFAFLRYTIMVGICSIMAAYVLHVCGQLDIVIMLLNQYIDNTNTDKTIHLDCTQRKKLSIIVTCHARALRLAARIEKTFNFMNLVDFIGCTFQICFTGFLLVMTLGGKPLIWVTWALLLISFVFNIFIICHIGEYLTQKCQEIGEIAYSIKWYDFSSKRAMNLMNIMIISSSYPTRLTAGKMVYLTMTTFSQVLSKDY
ncbi:odorant receptor 67c-like [Trichogramma pretiosum]|uniref:odorant receptor 67c-like n=1 Tax=Trichogramma pretiosum TaxID=7493 RepID=UPI0006C987C8|nr:odorant receptor 67c-like [Trichogramma pretiosum]